LCAELLGHSHAVNAIALCDGKLVRPPF